MKKLVSGMFLSFALVLSLSLPGFGGEVTKSFTLTRDSKLDGAALTKGTYSVKFWDDKEGELVVMKGKNEVAKVKYKFVELKDAAADNTIAYTLADDGSYTVKRIEFKGLKSALVFEHGDEQPVR
jgi:NMD protein affecting ribosome stability and mRNA decay